MNVSDVLEHFNSNSATNDCKRLPIIRNLQQRPQHSYIRDITHSADKHFLHLWLEINSSHSVSCQALYHVKPQTLNL